MAMNNPAFSRNIAFKDRSTMTADELQKLHDLNSPNTVAEPAMTVQGTLTRSLLSFVVLLIGGAVGWFLVASNPTIAVGVFAISGIAAFVLAMVNIFKREPSPALILLYALFEGGLIGGLSQMYNSLWSGIVIQAVLGTGLVIGVTLALFASGKIRASARATRVWLIAMIAYLIMSLVNVMLVWFVPGMNPWGIGGISVFGIPLGVIIGILVVLMCAYSLVLDFDMVQRGVANEAPRKYEWTGAFSIMVTVVWLYLEILRILAFTRQ